jgi:methylenetetrahydrofolate dehydrogenase (NADP+)/methenyltetrahydrofolate cyclohydrolase
MRVLAAEPVVAAVERRVRERLHALAERGVRAKLALFSVGDDAASQVYLGRKEETARRLGIAIERRAWKASDPPARVAEAMSETGGDAAVHGVLLQLPLPAGWDTRSLLDRLPPDKDVDGLHPVNAGRLALGLDGFVPCTPLGVLALLTHYEIPLAGRRAVVMGRSAIVGRPLSLLLSGKSVDATVTVVHSRSAGAAAICREAEVLIAAIGRPRAVTAEFVRPGAAVVDVGIHRVADPERPGRTRLVGDVDVESVARVAGALSPVPGGVGPLTVAFLMENTVRAAERLTSGAPAPAGERRP